MAEKGQRRRREQAAPAEETPIEESFDAERESSPVRDLEDLYSDVRDRVCDMFEVPEEARIHLRNARKEVLMAFRSFLDARIACIDEANERQEATRRTRVNID